jgi:acyl carrier protein
MERDKVIATIVEKVQDLDPPNLVAWSAPLDEGTVLLGEGGLLDSLGLVTLLADLEQDVADQTGVAITIGDDQAMSARHSPFRTIGSLADYTLGLIGRDG